jgi:hypothetical protein
LGGTALLSGLYFTWRTLQVNREGLITDRFTRAIDQLGKTDDEGHRLLEIRLGGIYALERIARESEEDHWPIMEVLTAYVRQHARWLPKEGQEGAEDATVDEKSEEGAGEKYKITEVPALAPDIQAIMTVIRRRTRSFGHREPEGLDLHGSNLSGADLTNARLWRANLRQAVLEEANLSGAILLGADLTNARLRGMDFSGADLTTVNLREADLRRANLSEARLTQDQLEEANGDENTRLPPHLKPPSNWGVKTNEQIEED